MRLPLLVLPFALGAVALAQVPSRPAPGMGMGTRPQITLGPDQITFGANVGSFKLRGSDKVPVRGTLVLNFNGSVLVSGLKGTITPAGNVREEYKNDRQQKRLFFGKGRLVISGSLRSVQFFGRDMRGQFKGVGLFQFFGEFDQKLDTGFYQFPGDAPAPWGTGGRTIAVPKQVIGGATPNVRVKKTG